MIRLSNADRGNFYMAHSGKNLAKAWNPPAQKGKPRTGGNVASSTECTGLTPAELYAVHTLKPSDASKER